MFCENKKCVGLAFFVEKHTCYDMSVQIRPQNVQEGIQQARKKLNYILTRRRRSAHRLVWSSHGQETHK